MVIRPVVLLMLTPVGVPANEYSIKEGVPVAFTWNVPPVPLTTDVLFALVKVGAMAAAVTVSVKFCVVFGNILLLAMMINS